MRRPHRPPRPDATVLAVLAALALGAAPARAQEATPDLGGQASPDPHGQDTPGEQPPGFPTRPAPPGPPQEPGSLDLRDLESWIVLEEEQAPEPPLLRVSTGGVAWIQARSQLRSSKFGVSGTRLDDLEEEQGLDGSGFSPWAEATIGRSVRGGADYLELYRRGSPQLQTEDVAFEGVTVARRGDRCAVDLSFLTASARIEWDGLYGRTYRLGLLGGLRYFHITSRMEGRPAFGGPSLAVHRSAELLSPFFGGLVELTPFEFLSVTTRVEFMNWSWRRVGLRDASYLDLRIGATVHFIPGTLGVGLEYRFAYVRASSDEQGGEFEAGVSAAGVALTLSLSF